MDPHLTRSMPVLLPCPVVSPVYYSGLAPRWVQRRQQPRHCYINGVRTKLIGRDAYPNPRHSPCRLILCGAPGSSGTVLFSKTTCGSSSSELARSGVFCSTEDLRDRGSRGPRRAASCEELAQNVQLASAWDSRFSESGVSLGDSRTDLGSLADSEDGDTVSRSSFGSSSAFHEMTGDSEMMDVRADWSSSSPHGVPQPRKERRGSGSRENFLSEMTASGSGRSSPSGRKEFYHSTPTKRGSPVPLSIFPGDDEDAPFPSHPLPKDALHESLGPPYHLFGSAPQLPACRSPTPSPPPSPTSPLLPRRSLLQRQVDGDLPGERATDGGDPSFGSLGDVAAYVDSRRATVSRQRREFFASLQDCSTLEPPQSAGQSVRSWLTTGHPQRLVPRGEVAGGPQQGDDSRARRPPSPPPSSSLARPSETVRDRVRAMEREAGGQEVKPHPLHGTDHGRKARGAGLDPSLGQGTCVSTEHAPRALLASSSSSSSGTESTTTIGADQLVPLNASASARLKEDSSVRVPPSPSSLQQQQLNASALCETASSGETAAASSARGGSVVEEEGGGRFSQTHAQRALHFSSTGEIGEDSRESAREGTENNKDKTAFCCKSGKDWIENRTDTSDIGKVSCERATELTDNNNQDKRNIGKVCCERATELTDNNQDTRDIGKVSCERATELTDNNQDTSDIGKVCCERTTELTDNNNQDTRDIGKVSCERAKNRTENNWDKTDGRAGLLMCNNNLCDFSITADVRRLGERELQTVVGVEPVAFTQSVPTCVEPVAFTQSVPTCVASVASTQSVPTCVAPVASTQSVSTCVALVASTQSVPKPALSALPAHHVARSDLDLVAPPPAAPQATRTATTFPLPPFCPPSCPPTALLASPPAWDTPVTSYAPADRQQMENVHTTVSTACPTSHDTIVRPESSATVATREGGLTFSPMTLPVSPCYSRVRASAQTTREDETATDVEPTAAATRVSWTTVVDDGDQAVSSDTAPLQDAVNRRRHPRYTSEEVVTTTTTTRGHTICQHGNAACAASEEAGPVAHPSSWSAAAESEAVAVSERRARDTSAKRVDAALQRVDTALQRVDTGSAGSGRQTGLLDSLEQQLSLLSANASFGEGDPSSPRSEYRDRGEASLPPVGLRDLSARVQGTGAATIALDTSVNLALNLNTSVNLALNLNTSVNRLMTTCGTGPSHGNLPLSLDNHALTPVTRAVTLGSPAELGSRPSLGPAVTDFIKSNTEASSGHAPLSQEANASWADSFDGKYSRGDVDGALVSLEKRDRVSALWRPLASSSEGDSSDHYTSLSTTDHSQQDSDSSDLPASSEYAGDDSGREDYDNVHSFQDFVSGLRGGSTSGRTDNPQHGGKAANPDPRTPLLRSAFIHETILEADDESEGVRGGEGELWATTSLSTYKTSFHFSLPTQSSPKMLHVAPALNVQLWSTDRAISDLSASRETIDHAEVLGQDCQTPPVAAGDDTDSSRLDVGEKQAWSDDQAHHASSGHVLQDLSDRLASFNDSSFDVFQQSPDAYASRVSGSVLDTALWRPSACNSPSPSDVSEGAVYSNSAVAEVKKNATLSEIASAFKSAGEAAPVVSKWSLPCGRNALTVSRKIQWVHEKVLLFQRLLNDLDLQTKTREQQLLDEMVALETGRARDVSHVGESPRASMGERGGLCDDLCRSFTREFLEQRQNHVCPFIEDELPVLRFKRFLKKVHNCRVGGGGMFRVRHRLGGLKEDDSGAWCAVDLIATSGGRPAPCRDGERVSAFQHHHGPGYQGQPGAGLVSPVTVHDRLVSDVFVTDDGDAQRSFSSFSDSAYSTMSEASSRHVSDLDSLCRASRSSRGDVSRLAPDVNPEREKMASLGDVFDPFDVSEGEIDPSLLNRLRVGHYKADTL